MRCLSGQNTTGQNTAMTKYPPDKIPSDKTDKMPLGHNAMH